MILTFEIEYLIKRQCTKIKTKIVLLSSAAPPQRQSQHSKNDIAEVKRWVFRHINCCVSLKLVRNSICTPCRENEDARVGKKSYVQQTCVQPWILPNNPSCAQIRHKHKLCRLHPETFDCIDVELEDILYNINNKLDLKLMESFWEEEESVYYDLVKRNGWNFNWLLLWIRIWWSFNTHL